MASTYEVDENENIVKEDNIKPSIIECNAVKVKNYTSCCLQEYGKVTIHIDRYIVAVTLSLSKIAP